MILRRQEAIILSSFFYFFGLSDEQRNKIIESALAEKSLEREDVAAEVSNYHARKYVEYQFSYFTNSYLQIFLSAKLARPVQVKGRGRKLFPCLCCDYKTLNRRGEYSICHVCFWEDDGNSELNRYSSVNRMTLFQAKENFKKLGVMDDGYQEFVNPDRMIQFEKVNEKYIDKVIKKKC